MYEARKEVWYFTEDLTSIICHGINKLNEFISMLDNNIISVQKRDFHGWTLLHLAAHYGSSEEFLQVLLDRGANVNAQEEHGFTPLHFAAMKGYSLKVQVLLENGANMYIKSNKDFYEFIPANSTPLETAKYAKQGDYAVIILFLSSPDIVRQLQSDRIKITGPDEWKRLYTRRLNNYVNVIHPRACTLEFLISLRRELL